MKTVTLDVEVQRWFDEIGKRDHRLLGISYVGIYEEESDRLHGFFENELNDLWPILEKADLVIGYNILKFDYPVLAPYYSGDLLKLPTFDLLSAVQETLGFRLKLDSLAKATLGEVKTRPGSEAIWLYRQGKLDELAAYCLNDVQLTYKLYARARAGRALKYVDHKGETR
jgi:DEAD/DEAH box helicase domain-containing protein